MGRRVPRDRRLGLLNHALERPRLHLVRLGKHDLVGHGGGVELLHHLPIATLDAMARIDEQRSEEHTSELQSLMRISYAVFCLKKKNTNISDKYIIKTLMYLQITLPQNIQYEHTNQIIKIYD